MKKIGTEVPIFFIQIYILLLALFLRGDGSLHFLAGLESGSLGSGDLDLLARAGIPAGAGAAGADFEGSEANQGHLAVFGQAFNDAIQGGAQDFAGFSLGDFGFGGDDFYEFSFIHSIVLSALRHFTFDWIIAHKALFANTFQRKTYRKRVFFSDPAYPQHAVDRLELLHHVVGHGMADVQERVGIVSAALVRQVFDVQALAAEERGDLAQHVRDVPVQDRHAGLGLAASEVDLREVHGVVDVAVVQVVLHLLHGHHRAVVLRLLGGSAQVRNHDRLLHFFMILPSHFFTRLA